MNADNICIICSQGIRPLSSDSLSTDGRHLLPSVEVNRIFRPTMESSELSSPRFLSPSKTESDLITEANNRFLPSPCTVPTSSIHSSDEDETFIVYSPDLPSDKTDTVLAQMIRKRLEHNSKISMVDIKCYGRFGIGVGYVQSQFDKQYFVSYVRSIVLNPLSSTIISFTDFPGLVSYIDFDSKAKTIATEHNVQQRWTEIYKSTPLEQYQSVSAFFPNIFRIVFTSVDDLLEASTITDFVVNNQLATIYFRADCSYFEDLPAELNEEELFSSITRRIGFNTSTISSLYVQYNRNAKTAIVLATDQVRKWIREAL